MTAEPGHGGRPAPAPVRADLFLLAGRFPGTSPGQALKNTLTYALAAEQAGFTGVWIAEHHFLSYGTCPSALAMAAYLLGHTTTLRVGTAACILSTRHPVALGEEAALLAEVSGGRLDLGVGRGGPGSTWRSSAPAWTGTKPASPNRSTCSWPGSPVPGKSVPVAGTSASGP